MCLVFPRIHRSTRCVLIPMSRITEDNEEREEETDTSFLSRVKASIYTYIHLPQPLTQTISTAIYIYIFFLIYILFFLRDHLGNKELTVFLRLRGSLSSLAGGK